MSHDYHAIVWVNHTEAKVYRFSADAMSEADLHSHTSLQRLHHSRTGWEAGGNPPDDLEFFARINAALDHAQGVIIAGPGNAKSALKAFLDHARPGLNSRVLIVETAEDRPDALVALGRQHFEEGASVSRTPKPQLSP